MKKLKQFIENYPNNGLSKAVIDYVGEESFIESAKDVAMHGASGGTWSELIYYDDTIRFSLNNYCEIRECLKERADDLGETVIYILSGFTELYGLDSDEIAEAFYTKDKEHEYHVPLFNALAWYAAEKVASDFCQSQENQQ